MTNTEKLKKGITLIFGVNVLSMIFSILMNFLLPKFLAIDTYATIQSYNLYVGFSGLFTLGFTDGIYLKYGGNNINSINIDILEKDLSTFRIFQSTLVFLGLVLYIFTKDIVLLFAGLALFPLNMTSFFSLLFQATGEFKSYSKITGLKATIVFIINSFLLTISLFFGYENPIAFLFLYLFLNIIYWIILECNFVRAGNKLVINCFDSMSFKENIISGLPLTLGTFTSVLFTSVDRMFTKGLLDIASFAYYSFAVSIDNFLNTAISPVTITLYNYLCTHREVKQVKRLRRYVTIFVIIIASTCFIAQFLIKHYIKKYVPSIDVLFWLFSGKILYVIIQAIYVNLYKSTKRQTLYFKNLVIVIVLNIIVNYLIFLIVRTSVSFAIGTMVSNIVWFLLCIRDFKEYRPDFMEMLYVFIMISTMLFFGHILSPILGFTLYVIVAILLAWLLMKDESIYLYTQLLKLILRRKKSGQ